MRHSAFSLLEILVAMAIAGLLLILVPIPLKWYQGAQTQHWTQQFNLNFADSQKISASQFRSTRWFFEKDQVLLKYKNGNLWDIGPSFKYPKHWVLKDEKELGTSETGSPSPAGSVCWQAENKTHCFILTPVTGQFRWQHE